MSENGKVLEVRGLKTYFYTDEGVVKAVDGLAHERKTVFREFCLFFDENAVSWFLVGDGSL